MQENNRKNLKYRGKNCLNCEFPLEPNHRYCPNCAQLNTTKKLTLSDLINEFFTNIFSYDSKIYRTLKALTLSPGRTATAFLNGERVKFTNPFRLYISACIIFFIILGIKKNLENNEKVASPDLIENKLEAFQLLSKKDLDRDSILRSLKSESELSKINIWQRNEAKIQTYLTYFELNQETQIDSALVRLDHTPNWWNRRLYGKAADYYYISQNPTAFDDYLKSKLPIFAFIFMPIFALVFWLLYRKKKLGYMSHLVFLSYCQSIVFLLLTAIAIVSFIPYEIIEKVAKIGLLIWILIYIVLSLKKFYNDSWLKTVAKFMLLSFIFALILGAMIGVGPLLGFIFY